MKKIFCRGAAGVEKHNQRAPLSPTSTDGISQSYTEEQKEPLSSPEVQGQITRITNTDVSTHGQTEEQLN